MRRTLLALVVWLLCSVAAAGITTSTGEDTFEVGDAIVLNVELDGVPEGAVIKGDAVLKISTDASKYTLKKFGNEYGCWGTPGTYHASILAMWGVQTPGAKTWDDFGLFSYEATFTVTGDGPDPPDPPEPGGLKKIWFATTAAGKDNLPTYANSLTFRQKLEALGHDYQETLFQKVIESPPSRLSKIAQAVREAGIPYPVVVLEPINGGPIRVLSLPSSEGEMLEVLK